MDENKQQQNKEGADPFHGLKVQLDTALAEISHYQANERRLLAAIGEEVIREQKLKEENAALRSHFDGETQGHRGILRVLDDVERMRAAIRDNYGGTWVDEGASRVYEAFKEALFPMGILKIECEPGVLFDPAFHEALAMEAGSKGVVIRVLRGGYKYSDGNIIQAVGVTVGNGE